MRYFGHGIGFSEKHKELSKILRNAAKVEEAKQDFLIFHTTLNAD
jgi:hypothetical protein